MKKVKVHRYISGKRPEYAQSNSSDEESEEEDFIDKNKNDRREEDERERRSRDREDEDDYGHRSGAGGSHREEYDDPRLRRLNSRRYDDDYQDRVERHRHIHEPEIVTSSEDEEEPQMELEQMQSKRITLASDSESDGELSDTEIERRRQTLRQKMLQQKKEEELLAKEDEGQSESSESESSEYEEETESEEENEPRLKPLFVRKRDRATIIEKEKEVVKQKQVEHEAKKMAKERRRHTLRLVEESVKQDLEKVKKVESAEPNINDVCTDDENDEVEYEAWKLRELKRIKRDREEKESFDKEHTEIDRLRNMTEEERRQELRLNPKLVTNKAAKGKYKFLQKYYHRGAFYLDEEAEVFKRDFSQATLEDHFDKTILPKVMQVKNFGRCGRTKYTHLVDQDTTQFDSPWYGETANNVKFHNEKSGGMKQVFERPSLFKRKKME